MTTDTFPAFTENAIVVMNRRYLKKDNTTKMPTEEPDDMFLRVSKDLAEGDRPYGADDETIAATSGLFYGIMRRLEFLPNSPTLMNAGRDLQQLSACFVLPVEDNLDSIFSRVKDTALIHQSGGGTGFAFSRLRPAGDIVKSTGGVASGPVSFIRPFDGATDVVKQGGTRRGANMAVLSVYHPDILGFIHSKRDNRSLQNFNISVAVDKEFMDRVEAGLAYDVVNPRTEKAEGSLDARVVFNEIVQSAWATGDPGMVFIDRINEDNPNPHLGKIESTNPCVAGDTIVATTAGPRRADELLGKGFIAVVNGQEWPSTDAGFFPTGRRTTLEIETEGGHRIRVTPDHRMRRREGDGDEWAEARTIQIGDGLVLQQYSDGQDGGAQRAMHAREANARGAPVIEREITNTEACPADRVTSISEREAEPVYDAQIPGINAFDGNGFYVHQCGEQPLLPWESCNLGSINLVRMLTTRAPYKFDWDKLETIAQTAVHLLDNVIERNEWPVDEIGDMTRKTRRIGVGVMGWADALTKMRIRYDSEEALELAKEVMQRINEAVQRASEALAEKRGPYPAWEGSRYEQAGRKEMRNSAPTTIAPTGTISVIAGVSSGIEPLFALAYKRNVLDGEELLELNDDLMEAAEADGFMSAELMNSLRETGMIGEDVDVPDWVRNVFRTSQQIDPVWHVKMQAAFQSYTENAVSKTVNLAHESLPGDVEDAYWAAWREGCKGITVYRDGSKDEQVLNAGSNGAVPRHSTGTGLVAAQRPEVLAGKSYRIRTGHGNAYIIVNRDEKGNIFEVFSATGKAGSCNGAAMQALTMMTSLALRAGVAVEEVAEQLRGNACCPRWDEGVLVQSPMDAIGIALEKAMGVEHAKATEEEQEMISNLSGYVRGTRRCPDCNGYAFLAENCLVCRSCGWSECG